MRKLDVPPEGSLGEEVVSENHYGTHWRKKSHPTKKRTAVRLQADEAMRVVAEAWNSLTDEQQDLWAVTGANEPSRTVFGKAGRLDARGAFFKVNLPRARLCQRVLTEPLAKPDFGPSPFVAFTITNDGEGMALMLTLARAPAEDLLVRASPPYNRGRRRDWDYRVVGLVKTPVKGPNNITRLYVDRFDVPTVGKRIFLEVRQQAYGWRGRPWKASAVVPPWKAVATSRRGGRHKAPHPGV